jgi:hypothetical protein
MYIMINGQLLLLFYPFKIMSFFLFMSFLALWPLKKGADMVCKF